MLVMIIMGILAMIGVQAYVSSQAKGRGYGPEREFERNFPSAGAVL